MKTFPYHYAALAIVVTLLTTLLPSRFALPSTYTAALVLILGIATVVLITWRNALPTDTVAQLLQRTENPDASGTTRTPGRSSTRRS